ncbi:hypothetical protein ACH3XW_2100 [Acanthocheilonema viteae]
MALLLLRSKYLYMNCICLLLHGEKRKTRNYAFLITTITKKNMVSCSKEISECTEFIILVVRYGKLSS